MSEMTVNAARDNAPRQVGGSRWLYAALGMLLFLFQGMIYAWSVFMPPLESEFGWTRADTAMVFSVCMSFFCVGNIAAGFISLRKPARFAVVVSALSVGLGFLLGSFSDGLLTMYASYGGLVGFGVGLGYNAILSTVLKWFPDKPGLVGGVLLMGFGGGALVLGTLCHWLATQVGWRSTFQILSLAYTVLFLFASLRIKPPAPGLGFPMPLARSDKKREEGGEVSTREMVRRRSFHLYFIWASAVAAIGYILIGHAVPMVVSEGVQPAQAATMAGIISLFNGIGRMAGGASFDFFGRKVVMRFCSCGYLLGAVLLWAALGSGNQTLLTAVFGLVGLCLGCSILCNAAVIKTFYGLKHYPLNFGMMCVSTVIAAFAGPYVVGLLHNLMGSYAAAPACMLVLGGLALAAALALKKP